ncbi:bactofilin family protein [Alterisphingorhabdus coralli]|uniref:Polymer-forming cytoskeletal protein n=1 Tax=Alterisphingorhabdus coralli TaxID=3071408 RepID=A0AA97I1R8_9SPHN|nr:polymer-forming cytoskeletal protein [Parasphingorhabdus sp. SCSIO 66989]WOE75035.1 polymer-forming cytoskeletal protein [Parasphingorhabdus sp. SCSIO 66989]
MASRSARGSMGGGTTFSVIGSDVVITGNISAKVDLHVDGRIDGDLQCASLVQGEGSEIHGAIVAQTARLAGLVEGSIDASELVIESSARITGDVSYETITIEQGGNVDGKFRHKSNAAETPKITARDDSTATLDLSPDKAA